MCTGSSERDRIGGEGGGDAEKNKEWHSFREDDDDEGKRAGALVRFRET